MEIEDPKAATIDELRKLARPKSLAKRAPEEKKAYTVSAVLLRWHREKDGDYHLVLAGPDGETLIAEIPDPTCVPADEERPYTSAHARIESARSDFEDNVLRRALPPGARLTVTGVGFFDFLHGQDGVAPNGFELHPVLSVLVEEP